MSSWILEVVAEELAETTIQSQGINIDFAGELATREKDVDKVRVVGEWVDSVLNVGQLKVDPIDGRRVDAVVKDTNSNQLRKYLSNDWFGDSTSLRRFQQLSHRDEVFVAERFNQFINRRFGAVGTTRSTERAQGEESAAGQQCERADHSQKPRCPTCSSRSLGRSDGIRRCIENRCSRR